MALFAGLRAEPGRLPGNLRRHREARARGATGEPRSRQKVNAWRGLQPPEIAKLGRPTLSNMADKLLRTHGGRRRSVTIGCMGCLYRARILEFLYRSEEVSFMMSLGLCHHVPQE